ncbi:hypothetical protein GALMADRAFT_712896 [Galerina marginata CBS 339.88]|uniref:Uncharacterized protein n=1 Tax=Galerina marginata (strain CBS 339.88) TaxID=685588 RepID=A0A067TML3_GALM3|nr:hypothetical protein GALMADRAFT_712896 [Galerina marginata CBS 339.88]
MASQVNAEDDGLGYADQCRHCMRKQNLPCRATHVNSVSKSVRLGDFNVSNRE